MFSIQRKVSILGYTEIYYIGIIGEKVISNHLIFLHMYNVIILIS